MTKADEEDKAMPDGKRKRRRSSDPAKRRWYAQHRPMRFCRRFGLGRNCHA
jgi:hypothetical protein